MLHKTLLAEEDGYYNSPESKQRILSGYRLLFEALKEDLGMYDIHRSI